jgi:predicted GH43/DUF377 family glycosyl hydrolase
MTFSAADAGVEWEASAGRVVAQLLLPGETLAPRRPRAELIYERVRGLDPDLAATLAAQILDDFAGRHHDLHAILERNGRAALDRIGGTLDVDSDLFAVFAASFTQEFAIEGAALCNPSPAPHPDQSGLAAGDLRVALTLRSIGEGHISSLSFGSAVVGNGTWRFEERRMPLRVPELEPIDGGWIDYRATFPGDSDLSQRVLSPVIEPENKGIEDARLVRVVDLDGAVDYRATYTAYDGSGVSPRLLRSPDLVRFTSHALSGPAATNKGIALFPRPVGGRLLALVRSDGETNSLGRSSDGMVWTDETPLAIGKRPWELVTSGNCGSPIETSEGWLVMTHGVGPMRVYTMGAMLLDLEDPVRVIKSLKEPILAPDARRDGYVPSVVYSCGSIVHDGRVWIPYGAGDVRIRVASADLDELLAAMT